MIKFKQILFFTRGNSNDISTWSNIPYLFCKTLEEYDIKVIRVNINNSYILSKFWNKTIFKLIDVLFPNHTYEAIRTKWYNYLTYKKIEKSILDNPQVDLCIFTTFSFYNKFNNIPTLQLGDWTYEILIRERLNRKPYFFEQWFINQESEAIRKSNLTISLFPKCRDFIIKAIPDSNVKWGKLNVVNTLLNKEIDSYSIIKNKFISNKLLFIGRSHYIEGANLLIKTFIEVKKTYPLLELHIIGLSNNDFKELPKDVFCHGFLRKENKKECTTYYNLLLDSKIFINPTPKWGGYSSTIESMFYYTPIIISPYKDFVEEFGTNIDFGLYNEQFTIKSLKNNINSILSLDNIKYMNMCSSSHNKVKNYTWTNYVKWIIEELNTSL